MFLVTCGEGDNFCNSVVKILRGENIKASSEYCLLVEEQPIRTKLRDSKLLGAYVSGQKEFGF